MYGEYRNDAPCIYLLLLAYVKVNVKVNVKVKMKVKVKVKVKGEN